MPDDKNVFDVLVLMLKFTRGADTLVSDDMRRVMKISCDVIAPAVISHTV